MLDGVGGEAGRAAFELLGPGGRIVLFGWSSGEPTQLSSEDLLARSLTASAGLGPAHPRPACASWRSARSPRPRTARSCRCSTTASRSSAAAEAHAALEGRGTVGKVVLVRS